jgi:hypothetical protein
MIWPILIGLVCASTVPDEKTQIPSHYREYPCGEFTHAPLASFDFSVGID